MSPSTLNRFVYVIACRCLTGCDYTGAQTRDDPGHAAAAEARAAMVQNELTEERTEFQSEARLRLGHMDAKLQRLTSASDGASVQQLVRRKSALNEQIAAADARDLAEWDHLELTLEGRIETLERGIDQALQQAGAARSRKPEQSAGSAR